MSICASWLELSNFDCFVATKYTKETKYLLRGKDEWNFVEHFVRIL